jgi:hypothetical protein
MKRWLIALLICGLVWMGATPAKNSSAQVAPSPQPGQEALVLLAATQPDEMQAALSAIQAAGGQVFASFPNQGAFVWLAGEQAAAVQQLREVRLVSFGPVDIAAAQGDDGAYAAITSWNARLQTQTSFAPQTAPGLPDGDVLLPPDREQAQAKAAATDPALPNQYQTSEFMTNRIHVDVFLLESNGAVDANQETWTTAMRDEVVAEVTNGVTWWATAATQGGKPSAGLVTNIAFHTPFNEPAVVATSYEPISRSSSDQGLWIGQVMSHLGYSEYNFDAVRHYAHDRRTSLGYDWAFSVFIANSYNDSDGMFTNARFGYAYLGGPFLVMTYDNDGWGISRMEMVTAHEMSHIFYGLDEYASSACADTDLSGYLNIANTNCENGTAATENSIMRNADNQQLAYPAYQVSTPVRGMVGWRDSDGDGRYDPVDTIPALSLTAYTPDPTTDTTPTWSGSVQDTPWNSPTHTDTSINIITTVQYRIDGGAWGNCSAVDGVFDETTETFTCTPPALADGAHTIQVQATNRSGNQSNIASDTLTVIGGVVPGAFNKSAPVNSASAQPVPLTLTWGSSSGASSYEYCYDTSNDSACTSGNWVSAGSNLSVVPSGLANNTTYYWQVRARNLTGTTDANGGTWWSFTTQVALPGAFNKSTPTTGATNQPISLALTWSNSSGASSYEYCYDTTNDNVCAGNNWRSVGTYTGVGLENLGYYTTYYWQVRARNAAGTTESNGGAWASFRSQANYAAWVYLPLVRR